MEYFLVAIPGGPLLFRRDWRTNADFVGLIRGEANVAPIHDDQLELTASLYPKAFNTRSNNTLDTPRRVETAILANQNWSTRNQVVADLAVCLPDATQSGSNFAPGGSDTIGQLANQIHHL